MTESCHCLSVTQIAQFDVAGIFDAAKKDIRAHLGINPELPKVRTILAHSSAKERKSYEISSAEVHDAVGRKFFRAGAATATHTAEDQNEDVKKSSAACGAGCRLAHAGAGRRNSVSQDGPP